MTENAARGREYRQIREAAWQFTTKYMREQGLSPSEKLLKNLATAGVRKYAQARGAPVGYVQERAVAHDVARAIIRNWDAAKARPAPAVSRAARAAADAKILALVHHPEKPRSIRQAAEELGINKSRVQRAVAKAGLRSDMGRKNPSAGARRLLSIVEISVPTDGKRAVDRNQIMRIASIDDENADGVLAELNASNASTHFLQSDVKSCFGSNWLVISRGRRHPEKKLLEWLRAADAARQSPGRHPLRPDQRKFIVDPQLPVVDPVQRDLLAVAGVAGNTRSLSAWRHFLSISYDPYVEGVTVDVEAIVTAVQSMLRLSEVDLESASQRAERWPSDPNTRAVAQKLLSAARYMATFANYRGIMEAVEIWCEEFKYRKRIATGHLPGRSIEVLDALLTQEFDGDWLITMPPVGRAEVSAWIPWEDDPVDDSENCNDKDLARLNEILEAMQAKKNKDIFWVATSATRRAESSGPAAMDEYFDTPAFLQKKTAISSFKRTDSADEEVAEEPWIDEDDDPGYIYEPEED